MTADEARANTSGYIPQNVKTPYSIQWDFSVQHVFHQNYTFEARYLGTRGVHLFVQSHPNVMSPITPTRSIPTYLLGAERFYSRIAAVHSRRPH